MRDLVYRVYARRWVDSTDRDRVPRHVGIMLDGNRRWARAAGSSPVDGHRAGAAKIEEFLGWCEEMGVDVVTLWLLSPDNLNRPEAELSPLLKIINDVVTELGSTGRWHVNPIGALDILPGETVRALKEVGARTAGTPGLHVNVAIGYGGRREIADAVRSLLHEHAVRGTAIEDLAEELDAEHIAEHLYTR